MIANDLSAAAVDIMKQNVEINDLSPTDPEPSGGVGSATAKVRVNHGDAWYRSVLCRLTHLRHLSDLMYSHRPEKKRVDCVDLDPYGTAAPFIDSAVQAISDGGHIILRLLPSMCLSFSQDFCV